MNENIMKDEKDKRIEVLIKRLRHKGKTIAKLKNKLKAENIPLDISDAESEMNSIVNEYERVIEEKDDEILSLKNEISEFLVIISND